MKKIKIYRSIKNAEFKEDDHPRGKDGKFGKGGKGKETERKELFERAKEKNPKLARWNIDESAIDENGDYIIYHGTNEENYKKIMTEGLIAPDAPRFFTTTTKKETAEEFAKGYSGDKVIKFAIPLDEITDVLWKGGKTSAYNDTQHALKTGLLDKKYIKQNAVRIYRNAADQSEFNFDEDKHKRDAGGRFTSGGGGGSKKTDKKEIKKKEKLTTLNPTGGIFVDYKPEDIMNMELGENITTLSETAGFDPDEEIKVYRGISTGSGSIEPGDFITTNEQLAKDYAGTGKVISETVRAGDILDDSDEPLGEEYIYYPKEKPDEKKTFKKINYTTPKDAAPSPDGTKANWNPKSGGILFHGTGAKENFDFIEKDEDGVVFLTDDFNEATGYAKGGHRVGSEETGNERILYISTTDNNTLVSIDDEINEAVLDGEDDFKEIFDKARSQGADFAFFNHPSFDGEKEQRVIVALNPEKTLGQAHRGWSLAEKKKYFNSSQPRRFLYRGPRDGTGPGCNP